jgi:hypothetical protein
MMVQAHIRTSNQVIRSTLRALPDRGSGHRITTSDPNTLNSNVPRVSDAHGVAGNSCLACLMIGTVGAAVTITIWMWMGSGGDLQKKNGPGKWIKLGADSTEYSKQFDANTVTGFTLPEGAYIYLQGSANVDEAYVDFEPFPTTH